MIYKNKKVYQWLAFSLNIHIHFRHTICQSELFIMHGYSFTLHLELFLNLRTHKQEVLLWHAVETSFDVAIVNWWAVLMLNPLHIFQQS